MVIWATTNFFFHVAFSGCAMRLWTNSISNVSNHTVFFSMCMGVWVYGIQYVWVLPLCFILYEIFFFSNTRYSYISDARKYSRNALVLYKTSVGQFVTWNSAFNGTEIWVNILACQKKWAADVLQILKTKLHEPKSAAVCYHKELRS